MITSLVVLFVILLTALFIWRINYGLWLVIFLLPFEKLGTFALNAASGYPIVRPVQVAAASLIFAYVICVILKRIDPPRLNRPLKFLIAFVIWALVPVILVNYLPLWREYLILVFVSAVTFVFAQLTNTRTLKSMMIAGVASLAVVISIGFTQLVADQLGTINTINTLSPIYSKSVLGFTRIHSSLAEPLFLANFLLTPLLITSALLLGGLFRTKTAYLVFLTTILCFVLTVSRGGFLALTVGLSCVLIWIIHANLSKLSSIANNIIKILSVGALAVIIAVLVLSVQGNVARSIFDFVNPGNKMLVKSGSYEERKSALETAVSVIKEKPLTGYGVGGYSFRLHNYPAQRSAGDRVSINNQYVELVAEVGFIGLIIFAGLAISSIYQAHNLIMERGDKESRLMTTGLVSGLIALLIQYLSFSGLYITYFWVILGMTIGVSSRIIYSSKRTQIKSGAKSAV